MKKIYPFFLLALSSFFSFSQSQVFTSSGSFLVPTGVTSLTIEVVGAGGTGGTNGGGGGGGGGYAKGVYAVTPNLSIPVTIGAGGAGPLGGTSSVGTFLSASGGANGTTVANPAVGGGGAGGTGTNGNIVNRTGGNGGGAYYTYFGGGGGGAGGSVSNGGNGGNSIVYTTGNCNTPGGSAGIGGGTPGGNGGKGAGFTNNACTVSDPAAGGNVYGGGGGGGNGIGSAAGIGAAGYAIISWGTGSCTAPPAPASITVAPLPAICIGSTATLLTSSTGTVLWYTSPTGSTPVGTGTMFVTPPLPLTTIYYAEALTCTTSAVRTQVTVLVAIIPPVQVSSSPAQICAGAQATLTATGAIAYTWSPYNPATMTSSTGLSTVVSPSVSTIYSVTGTNNYCTKTATYNLAVNPPLMVQVVASQTSVCAGQPAMLFSNGAVNYVWSPYNPAVMNFSVGSNITVSPQATSIYTVTGSDPFCTGMATIAIAVMPTPTIGITTSQSEICRFETATLTASGASAYMWNTGINTSTLVTPASLTVTTSYIVMGTDADGCTNSASFTQSVSTCIGIKTNKVSDNAWMVYPNPNKGECNISSVIDFELIISNELGQVIKTLKLDEKNNHYLSIKNMSAGIYFITGKEDKTNFRQKIIVTE